MKILIVSFSDNADHQNTLFSLFEQLYPQYDVTVMGTRRPKIPTEITPNTWLVDCPPRPGICRETFFFWRLLKILHRIRRAKFDAIYFESLHVWNLPIMLFCGKKVHVYHVIHEVIPHEGDKEAAKVDWMNRAICRLSNTVVLHNRKYVKEMTARYAIAPERVKYLELWRKYPPFTPPVHSGRVLFFGRINPYKGVENLLEIVRLCPRISFDVIGRVDPQVDGIIRRLAQEPNVYLHTGYVSDREMEEAFIRADWVVMPYNSASQSGIIIDSYKYSRPVIAFNVGAIAEQIADGESGYLVEAGNNTKFAEVLQTALQMSPEQYDDLCGRAYRYGSEKYAAVSAAGRFMELIESGQPLPE